LIDRIGRLLTLILLVGVVGTLADLLLLGHVEGWQQLVPVVLLGLGVVVAPWHLLAPSSVSLRAVRGLGVLYVVSGLVGLWFHYEGNLEFEREMAPDAAGWPLIKAVLTGATPALAPGTMVWFGGLALVIAWIAGRGEQTAANIREE
jgi:hypothetical protein